MTAAREPGRGGGPPEVALQNPGRRAGLGLGRLRPWLEALLAEVAPGSTELTVRFVGDREMRRLNREWRDRDRPTDVLSFPAGATPGERPLGDIVVAVPTARRQAREAGHALERELRLLTLHGVLHCLGHDHETDDGEMERLERRLRRRWLDRDPGEPG